MIGFLLTIYRMIDSMEQADLLNKTRHFSNFLFSTNHHVSKEVDKLNTCTAKQSWKI